MQGDNIEASSAHGLAQAGLSVRLPQAGEVLSEAFVVVVTLETLMVVAVALTEEVMEGVTEEATGKSKE